MSDQGQAARRRARGSSYLRDRSGNPRGQREGLRGARGRAAGRAPDDDSWHGLRKQATSRGGRCASRRYAVPPAAQHRRDHSLTFVPAILEQEDRSWSGTSSFLLFLPIAGGTIPITRNISHGGAAVSAMRGFVADNHRANPTARAWTTVASRCGPIGMLPADCRIIPHRKKRPVDEIVQASEALNSYCSSIGLLRSLPRIGTLAALPKVEYRSNSAHARRQGARRHIYTYSVLIHAT